MVSVLLYPNASLHFRLIPGRKEKATSKMSLFRGPGRHSRSTGILNPYFPPAILKIHHVERNWPCAEQLVIASLTYMGAALCEESTEPSVRSKRTHMSCPATVDRFSSAVKAESRHLYHSHNRRGLLLHHLANPSQVFETLSMSLIGSIPPAATSRIIFQPCHVSSEPST